MVDEPKIYSLPTGVGDQSPDSYGLFYRRNLAWIATLMTVV